MTHRARPYMFAIALLAFPPCLTAQEDEEDLCKLGRSQSPIAIDTRAALESSLRTPAADYHGSGVVLWNYKGKTVKALLASSMGESGAGDEILSVENVEFRLYEIHFHRPGEHQVDGKIPDLEMHMVHRDALGNLAVLGVPIEVDDKAEDHKAIAQLWQWLPPGNDERRQLPDLFDPTGLLPESLVAYRYPGSLTTGLCAESVRWTVFSQPIKISRGQEKLYATIFREPYTRPLQPANGRVPLRTLP